MATGKFITFEGGEGCGKTTQVKRLKEVLEREGIEVLLTREPGGTRLAELIRGLLKEEFEDPPCARTELLLFLAARAQLVTNVIKPALARGVWVISDRFRDSTMAYQGYGRGLDLDLLDRANDFTCDGLQPDLTLLLDADPEVSHARMHGREEATHTTADRIERAGDEFHARLRKGFHELAAQHPERIVTIDANGTMDEVWERIWTSLKRLR
jgi:dTMP kinase